MRHDEMVRLKEQKLQAITEMRSLADAAGQRAGNGSWQAEDTQQFDRLEAQVKGINEKLERGQTMSSLGGETTVYGGGGTTSGGYSSYKEYRSAGKYKPVGTAEYASKFWQYATTMNPEELDPNLLVELRTMSKGTPSAGGYLVPADVSAQIIASARAAGPMQQVAKVFTTESGSEFRVPIFDPHGSAAWIAESASYAPSDETVSLATLQAFKAGTLIIVTEELITDSEVDLSSYLGSELGQRIGSLAETAYMVGDGTGKPLGIAHASSGVTATTLPAGQLTTMTYAAIVNALATLPLQYRQNASLIVADSVYQKFLLLADSTGAPIFNVNISTAGPDTLLGYPLYVSPDLAAAGANSRSMVFADFQLAFIIRQVNGVFLQRLDQLYAANGQLGFRAYRRTDSRIGLTDAARVIAFAAT